MSHFDTDLLVFAGVVLVFSIIVLIKPDIGWMWRIGRWVVRDATHRRHNRQRRRGHHVLCQHQHLKVKRDDAG